MLPYALFELRRTLKNPRFIVMTLAMPVLINIVFVKLNGSRFSGIALSTFAEGYMMNMAAFATVSACLSTAGHRLAQERASGWFSFLTLTPLRPIDIVGGKIIAAIGVGVPAVVAVFASGILVNGVRVSPVSLLLALGVVVAGSIAFAALGVVIGLLTTGETSYAAAMIALMFFAVVGGLWMPRETMPVWMGRVTELTPSYQIAQTGKNLLGGDGVLAWQPPLVFATWAIAFIAIALAAYRRSANPDR
jgi:ABC-2 type transport system permease protein